MTEPGNTTEGTWWQTYELSADAWAGWRIGPLHLHARRGSGDWLFSWRHDADPMTPGWTFEQPAAAEPDEVAAQTARYALRDSAATLRLEPLLADLPVIARPATALHIPSHQEAVLYVSTVVWLRAVAGDTLLLDMPVFRPSDTWFGADTVNGELCYASRTQARTSIDALTHLPHRAITPIVIVNEADSALQVQQLRVPVPYLALHADPNGRLWTDRIRFLRDEDSAQASVQMLGRESLPPDCELLAPPRQATPSQSLVRTFSRLFD